MIFAYYIIKYIVMIKRLLDSTGIYEVASAESAVIKFNEH